MPWDEGKWDGKIQVWVTQNDGAVRSVETVIDGALKFLEQEMQSVSAI